MYAQVEKPKENKSRVITTGSSQMKNGSKSTFQFIDNRPEAIAQRKLQEMANNHSTQHRQPIQKKENKTGLPDNVKAGLENLSAYSIDDDNVHRNSDQPAQLQAHAYTQGMDIHIGRGRERHFSHEAWHVMQQKQGRVKPSMQMKGKVKINDEAGLEKEADLMSRKVLSKDISRMRPREEKQLRSNSNNSDAVQLVRIKLRDEDKNLMDGLRQVPVNQEGDQTVEAPTELSDLSGLAEIGSSENIVLEGHGNTNDEGIRHGQGGWSPQALARFANKVPKPEDWSGSIILLGCSTGGITEEVSKAYYRLTKKAITVTGTLKNIKVGKNSEGIKFVGTDWSKYPEEERPKDLIIIRKVEKGIEDFHKLCFTRLTEIIKAMGKTTDDVSVVIPYDIGTLELDTWKLLPFEGHDPKYLWFERFKIHTAFDKLLDIIKNDTEVIVDRILRVKDKKRGIIAIRGNLIKALNKFKIEYEQAYLPLLQQVRGLGLKPIDLSNVGHVKQSRMENTSKFGGVLGESWTDRIGS